MKKIAVILLCFVLLLSGCRSLSKAEAFYTETRDDITLSTQYQYYFDDEGSVRCYWDNTGDDSLSFYDTFELHMLGDDGEWYVVDSGEEVSFNTGYCHGIDPRSRANARYSIELYTERLKDGKTYRISTFCFDDDGNNYQVFAEFTCDNKLAEEEMSEVSGGRYNKRGDPELGDFDVLTGNE